MSLLLRYAVSASRIAASFLVILLCKALYRLWPSKLRSAIEGNLRRYRYPDGDIEAKIRADIRFFTSLNFLWAVVRTEGKRFVESPSLSEAGKLFPDFSLVELKSRREMRLSDVMKKAGPGPLVVNFGSCSCPTFMAELGEYVALVDKYSRQDINFILVYVEEAHAVDTGDFALDSGYPQMKQPTSIEERLSNASALAEHTDIPIYVDTIYNWGQSLYGAFPERLFIIKDGRIVMKGDEGPFKYSIKEAENWIENNFDKNGNEPN